MHGRLARAARRREAAREEADALAPGLAKKFASLRTQSAKRGAMVHPRHPQSSQEEHLKLGHPQCLLDWEPRALVRLKTLGMKRDVLRFVAEHDLADFLQHGIGREAPDEPVVGRADEFHYDEHLDFKPDTERVTDAAKKRVRPVPGHEPSAAALDEFLQQPCVLLLLLNEERERRTSSACVRCACRRRYVPSPLSPSWKWERERASSRSAAVSGGGGSSQCGSGRLRRFC